jgi:hypothetical protein
MNVNGYKVKRNSELSPYQKKVEGIDNVILCVAEAERMLTEIGTSLVAEVEAPGKSTENHQKRRKFSWRGRPVRKLSA